MKSRILHVLRTHRPRRVTVDAIAREADLPVGDVIVGLRRLHGGKIRLADSPVEGVGLIDGPQPMLVEELQRPEGRIGHRAIVLGQTTSTNDVAFSHDVDGLVVFTDFQSGGRGRRGAAWTAPPGSSLLMSTLLRSEGPALPAHRLVLASAVAVAETLEQVAGLEVRIKWPNDVLVDDRKIAGILVESRSGAHVIGIGLNVHQSADEFDGDLASTATSVRAAGGRGIDRVLLANALLARLEEWIVHAAAADGADALHEQWRRRSATVGRRVELLHDRQTFTGTVVDIDPDVGLIVRLDSGGVRTFEPSTVHVLSH